MRSSRRQIRPEAEPPEGADFVVYKIPYPKTRE
jgi:hypothetical protein